ncbi:MAG: alanyl-tRNA editing protein [Clostridia bacterium]|nr:alanyl-tRNA editing protein [Clostridia bacterium]
MTIKLYEQDAYCKEFTATVTACQKEDEFYYITLDQTAFFPEGGGQAPDTGFVGGAEVLDVQIKDQIIVHKVAKPFEVGQRVQGQIDWDIRFDRMQNHTGEHLLSGVIHTAFGYNNIGFHMNDHLVTLDTDGVLTPEQVTLVEDISNQAIYENRKVTAYFPGEEVLKELEFRSKLDLTQGVRLVEIDGYDCCACCAPHVANTGEIGIIKVINFYPNKQGTRVEMVCGKRALKDYGRLHESNKEIMAMLSAKREETPMKVKQEQETMQALRADMKNLSQKLAWAQLTVGEVGNHVYGFSPEVSYEDLRYCINRLQEEHTGICALFSQTNQEDCIYILSSSDENIQSLVKEMNQGLNGRGGGKPTYAQGKVSATESEIEDWLREKLS